MSGCTMFCLIKMVYMTLVNMISVMQQLQEGLTVFLSVVMLR